MLIIHNPALCPKEQVGCTALVVDQGRRPLIHCWWECEEGSNFGEALSVPVRYLANTTSR